MVEILNFFLMVILYLWAPLLFVITKSHEVMMKGNFNHEKYMEAHVLKRIEPVGPKMCMQACSRYSGCNGINYYQGNFLCELLLEAPGDELVDKPGFKYGKLSEWSIENDLCRPNPCSRLHDCVITCNNRQICVKAKTGECQTGWIKDGTTLKCYWVSHVSSVKLNYEDARSYCFTEDAKLAEPLTETEIAFVTNLVKGTSRNYYIGCQDIYTEGKFVWDSSNLTISHSNWGNGEPNNYNGRENCVLLWAEINHKWNDKYCTTERYFICEKE